MPRDVLGTSKKQARVVSPIRPAASFDEVEEFSNVELPQKIEKPKLKAVSKTEGEGTSSIRSFSDPRPCQFTISDEVKDVLDSFAKQIQSKLRDYRKQNGAEGDKSRFTSSHVVSAMTSALLDEFELGDSCPKNEQELAELFRSKLKKKRS